MGDVEGSLEKWREGRVPSNVLYKRKINKKKQLIAIN